MSNPYFRFKQFTVWHDRCAMKVGTDGVLLGAWCDVAASHRILDVGCGTGLIALMVAQRTAGDVTVDGLEIDAEAAGQAAENVARSPWSDRVYVTKADFLDVVAAGAAPRYDLIVSNPPYFEHSLLPEDEARLTARHTERLTYAALLQGAADLLLPEGRVALIFPASLYPAVNAQARRYGLYPRRLTWVSGRAGLPPKRVLVEWSRGAASICGESHLAIETAPLQWTPEYKALTRDFYLQL